MQEINLYRLARFYVRNWLIIISLTATGLLGGLVYNTFIQTPLYRSDATLLFINSSQQSSTQDVTLLNNYVQLFRSRRVLQPVIDDQKINISYDKFVGSVSALNNKGTEVISLSVSTDNPNSSRNFLKEAVISFKKESKSLYVSDNLIIVDDASDSSTAYNVHKSAQLAIASSVGFVLSLIVLFFIYDVKGDKSKIKMTVNKRVNSKNISKRSVLKNKFILVRSKKTVSRPVPKKATKQITKKMPLNKVPVKKKNNTSKKATK